MSFFSLRRGRQTAARPTVHKLLATVAVLGAAASIAGLGTYATWTSTTSENHTISSGKPVTGRPPVLINASPA